MQLELFLVLVILYYFIGSFKPGKLYREVPPMMEGQQKKIQYQGWHGATTGKELWSEETDEVC